MYVSCKIYKDVHIECSFGLVFINDTVRYAFVYTVIYGVCLPHCLLLVSPVGISNK